MSRRGKVEVGIYRAMQDDRLGLKLTTDKPYANDKLPMYLSQVIDEVLQEFEDKEIT